MSSKLTVVPFKPTEEVSDRDPNQVLIEYLEEQLAAARAGDITGCIMAAQTHDYSSTYAIVGQLGSFSVIGAITVATNLLAAGTGEDC